MNAKYSLLLQKVNDTAKTIKDLVDDFDCVCTKIPRCEGKETANIYSQTWSGEEGEEAYVPSKITTNAFDWQVNLGTQGSSISVVRNNINALRKYLKGGDDKGSLLNIYSAYTGIGRQKLYLKSWEEDDYYVDKNGMTHAEFKVTFRVTDPTTLLVPNNATTPTTLDVYTASNVSSGGATATGHDFSWGDASASDSGDGSSA